MKTWCLFRKNGLWHFVYGYEAEWPYKKITACGKIINAASFYSRKERPEDRLCAKCLDKTTI